MSRVLVTGGAGFIPSNLIRHLLEHTRHEVVSLDALTYAGNLENLADVMSHPRLAFVHGDIRDAGLVREVVAGVDVIVNAAAESHVEKSILEGASEFVTTNVEGTQILLDAIRETPVERFLLVSSSEVYGTAERDPMDEEHPLNPRSPYAATKAGGDRLAYSYWVTYGLPIVIVRPFNNYGPRQHPEKVVPRFITQALAGEPLTIHGDGHASRDWLHVDDTASAIEALIDAPLERDRRRGRERRDRDRHLRRRDRAPRARRGRQPRRDDVARRGAARAGRPAHRLDRQARAADRLARVDRLRGRARADGRLVPRERGVVAGRPRTRPRLLVLGAGPAQLGLLEAARARADLDVIAVDRDPQAVGFALADERAVLSSEDEEAIDRLARARDVDGIVSPGADWPVGIAARVAERIGLPHPIDARTGALATSKARQREAFAAAGVPHARALDAARRRRSRFPCVVKAPDRQGQRGLALVTRREELDAALADGAAESRCGGVLVEELVDGPEVTVNAFSRRRPLHAVHGDRPPDGRAARVRRRARARLAVRCTTHEPVVDVARAAVEALGIRNGPVVHPASPRAERPGRDGGRGAARRRSRRRALPCRDGRRPERAGGRVRARRAGGTDGCKPAVRAAVGCAVVFLVPPEGRLVGGRRSRGGGGGRRGRVG